MASSMFWSKGAGVLSRIAALALAFALAVGFLTNANSACAQSAKPLALERQIMQCFDQQQYTRAAELIEDYLKGAPNDATMLYNLACARSRLDEFDTAATALLRAFKAGFNDIEHLRSDPDLAGLRGHPTYKTILEEADRIAAENAKSALERWRDKYGTEHYRYETDEKRRINYATALDEVSHREMREMLEKEADQLSKSLFESPPGYFILIAVPTPDDADKFFGGDDSLGGMYQHNLRRLVARDIGGSLRHEFFHAMHFGHMERLGQPHPLWIQEGLAALYEDYELGANGSIKFLPNDRQIIVKARAKAGRLTKWSDMVALSAQAFMDKAQHLYPQARSIFEFLADQGKLEGWYRAYVKHFDEDRTGLKAFEIAFDKPTQDVEKDWRRWVARQPEIDLQIRAGDAALGVRSKENGSNDGVLITDIVPGSTAARSRLRRGDVIVAIDERSTRSLMDLRKIIASHQVGDEVQLRVRRNGEYFTIRLILRPAPAGA